MQVLGNKLVTGLTTGEGEGGVEELTAVEVLDRETGEKQKHIHSNVPVTMSSSMVE